MRGLLTQSSRSGRKPELRRRSRHWGEYSESTSPAYAASFEYLSLAEGIEVTYYRQRYSALFIGSDGTIAFGSPGTGNNNLVDAFSSVACPIREADGSY